MKIQIMLQIITMSTFETCAKEFGGIKGFIAEIFIGFGVPDQWKRLLSDFAKVGMDSITAGNDLPWSKDAGEMPAYGAGNSGIR